MWFYGPLLHTLYQKVVRVNRRRRRVESEPQFKYECNAIRLPSTSHLASVRRLSQHKVQLAVWLRKDIHHRYEAFNITRFSTHLAEEENPQQFTQFLNDMRSGQVNVVCNSSYFPDAQAGTVAWIIESSNSNYWRWDRIQT